MDVASEDLGGREAGRDEAPRLMRCDLHVHTRYSGYVDLPVLEHLGRDSYSDPHEVYAVAKRRGMDLVTITDHDSIEGALLLAHLPDFIVGEEVTCVVPGGRNVHLNVWGIDEGQHEQIAARRRDADALFALLAEQRIPAAVNHLFSPLTGRRAVEDFHVALAGVGLIEAQNGMMPPATNEYARLVGKHLGLSTVGGSDAHTLARVGHTFTTVPRARNRDEFLAGLRAGLTVPAGGAGSYARLTADVARVVAAAYGEGGTEAWRRPWGWTRIAAMTGLAPLLPLLPLVTLGLHVKERLMAAGSFRAYVATLPGSAAFRGPSVLGPPLALGRGA
jgi:predicted metal-dependent phosphoesterase TrpH